MCGMSSRPFPRLLRCWGTANGRGRRLKRPMVAEIDDRLHAERLAPDRSKQTFPASLNELPDGVFVRHPSWGGDAYLVWGNGLFAWSAGGYTRRITRPIARTVEVLTPASTVAVIRAGYVPDIHASATECG